MSHLSLLSRSCHRTICDYTLSYRSSLSHGTLTVATHNHNLYDIGIVMAQQCLNTQYRILAIISEMARLLMSYAFHGNVLQIRMSDDVGEVEAYFHEERQNGHSYCFCRYKILVIISDNKMPVDVDLRKLISVFLSG